jgi:predicted phage replisome organizer/uncharacterized phage protein (TIGR02220 family)
LRDIDKEGGLMSDNKKYYYLRLKENFFDSEELILLESMPDGYMYSNILLKLYLRSLKNDGKLMVNERIPYNSVMLANVTRYPIAVVEKAIQTFIDLSLIEVLENGAIYLLDIQNFIGESSTEADRKRNYRAKIDQEKKSLSGQMSPECPDKNPPEIEIDIEKELKIDKEIDIPFRGIIDHLNKICGTNYKYTAESHRKHIRARWNEKYTLDDFKTVIDKKAEDWLNTEQAKFLRPETLFGNKFDGYLNQLASKKPNNKPKSQLDMIKNLLGEDDGAETDIKDTSTIDVSFSPFGDE